MSKLSTYHELHLLFQSFPKIRYPHKGSQDNGFYILYERGERTSFGLPRIVRIGNYSGTGRLFGKHSPSSNRSVFRRHIGKCLLARDGNTQASLEERITHYLRQHFSFVLLPRVPDDEIRARLYAGLIATLAQSEERRCSKNWLGRWHPSRVVREGCLWNIAHTSDRRLSNQEILFLHEHLSKQHTS